MNQYVATTTDTLYKYNCTGVPKKAGIYWIIAPENMDIQFVETASDIFAPLYTVELLTKKDQTCSNQRILYIKKASGKQGLLKRLQQYMKYGWNQAKNHKGARSIWQNKSNGMLLVVYKCCEDCDTREHRLLQEYHVENGCDPLANWKG